jgi:hypothetical protein
VAPLQMRAISQNLYEKVLKPYRTKQEQGVWRGVTYQKTLIF